MASVKRSTHTLVITRPKEDATELAQELMQKGYRCLIEPMLTIEPVLKNAPALQTALKHNPQAILATSRYALTVFARMSKRRDIPVLAVGKATASHARELGFKVRATAGGTARSLITVTKKLCPAEKGRLLYIRGSEISADIAKALKQHGLIVNSVIVYRAVAVQQFSKQLCNALEQGKVSAVLFFSERTAAHYVKLAKKHKTAENHETLSAFSISNKVAGSLEPLPWKHVRIATLPTAKNILKKVNSLLR